MEVVSGSGEEKEAKKVSAAFLRKAKSWHLLEQASVNSSNFNTKTTSPTINSVNNDHDEMTISGGS